MSEQQKIEKLEDLAPELAREMLARAANDDYIMTVGTYMELCELDLIVYRSDSLAYVDFTERGAALVREYQERQAKATGEWGGVNAAWEDRKQYDIATAHEQVASTGEESRPFDGADMAQQITDMLAAKDAVIGKMALDHVRDEKRIVDLEAANNQLREQFVSYDMTSRAMIERLEYQIGNIHNSLVTALDAPDGLTMADLLSAVHLLNWKSKKAARESMTIAAAINASDES